MQFALPARRKIMPFALAPLLPMGFASRVAQPVSCGGYPDPRPYRGFSAMLLAPARSGFI